MLTNFSLFTHTASTDHYPLSLHDALPILPHGDAVAPPDLARDAPVADVLHPVEVDFGPAVGPELDVAAFDGRDGEHPRSEEHTSELQSQSNLVCRLLLEKKKKIQYNKPQE